MVNFVDSTPLRVCKFRRRNAPLGQPKFDIADYLQQGKMSP
jgi:hypothetical protein